MATQQEINDLKEKIALSCRILGHRGVTKGSFGHVSARMPDEKDKFLIKSKGPEETALEFATARDIIIIDEEGAVLDAPQGLDAPNETAMHLAVYRRRTDVNSVIHTHPDWLVVLTAVEKPLLPIYAAYNPQGMRMCVDGIPLYPRSVTITNDQLGEDFMKYMGEKNVCALRGHGMTTAGRSVEEATSNSFTLFELARMNYLAYAIGDPKPVPQADIDEYAARQATGDGRRARWEQQRAARGERGESSGWRYYKQQLGEL